MIGKEKILVLLLLLSSSVFADGPLVIDTVFVAFDTETTGFSQKNDRLVEIGAVKFRGDGEVLAATNWLVNPQRSISYYATEVNGITTEMAAQAPLFDEVWPEFEAFCSDTVLLAHNAPFDVGFLRAELKRSEIDPPAFPVLDTLPLFRNWFPRALSHSLEPLSVYLGVSGDTYHRAEADSFHIINIFKVGMRHRSAMTLRRLEQDANGADRLDGRRHK
ncbi:MAG: 3'-5' exonuclease [Verrucomicrobia bacterium]|nr:3'-5' exonuclease [Verrucomicrobiota bacterium]